MNASSGYRFLKINKQINKHKQKMNIKRLKKKKLRKGELGQS